MTSTHPEISEQSKVEVQREGTGRVVIPLWKWPHYRSMGFTKCPGGQCPDELTERLHRQAAEREAAEDRRDEAPAVGPIPDATPEPRVAEDE